MSSYKWNVLISKNIANPEIPGLTKREIPVLETLFTSVICNFLIRVNTDRCLRQMFYVFFRKDVYLVNVLRTFRTVINSGRERDGDGLLDELSWITSSNAAYQQLQLNKQYWSNSCNVTSADLITFSVKTGRKRRRPMLQRSLRSVR